MSSSANLPPGFDPTKAVEVSAAGPSTQYSHYTYEGNACVYTDSSTNAQYIWDTITNTWKARNNYLFDGVTYWYTDETGAKFRWNTHSNAWESVLAQCQVPYVDRVPDVKIGQELAKRIAISKEKSKEAYASLIVDTVNYTKEGKERGHREASQLNHYFDHDAFVRQVNEGKEEKPKFTKKQIASLIRRKKEKKYKKSLEWLKKDY